VSTPTVHSARLNADLFLGKNAPSPPPANSVAMGDLMSAIPAGTLPPIPAHFGTATDFTNDDSANPAAGSWAIGGNGPDNTVAPGFQGCGDCDWISTAHVLMQAAKNAGRPVPPFTGLTVVDQYAAYSGYDLKTGANDNGTDMSDSIKWCQEKGFYDDNGTVYQFGQAVTIEPGNIEQLWAAAYLFEAVKIGVEVTTAQMDQFDASANPPGIMWRAARRRAGTASRRWGHLASSRGAAASGIRNGSLPARWTRGTASCSPNDIQR
jgi:hypothetical protein